MRNRKRELVNSDDYGKPLLIDIELDLRKLQVLDYTRSIRERTEKEGGLELGARKGSDFLIRPSTIFLLRKTRGGSLCSPLSLHST